MGSFPALLTELRPQNDEIPVIFPLKRESRTGDQFAADCVAHHGLIQAIPDHPKKFGLFPVNGG